MSGAGRKPSRLDVLDRRERDRSYELSLFLTMLSTFVYAGLCGVRSARDNGGNADWFFDNFGVLQSTRRQGMRAALGRVRAEDRGWIRCNIGKQSHG